MLFFLGLLKHVMLSFDGSLDHLLLCLLFSASFWSLLFLVFRSSRCLSLGDWLGFEANRCIHKVIRQRLWRFLGIFSCLFKMWVVIQDFFHRLALIGFEDWVIHAWRFQELDHALGVLIGGDAYLLQSTHTGPELINRCGLLPHSVDSIIFSRVLSLDFLHSIVVLLYLWVRISQRDLIEFDSIGQACDGEASDSGQVKPDSHFF